VWNVHQHPDISPLFLIDRGELNCFSIPGNIKSMGKIKRHTEIKFLAEISWKKLLKEEWYGRTIF